MKFGNRIVSCSRLVYASIQFAIRTSAMGPWCIGCRFFRGAPGPDAAVVYTWERGPRFSSETHEQSVGESSIEADRLETARRTGQRSRPLYHPSIIGDCHSHHSSLPAASAAAAAGLASARVREDPVRIMSIRLSVRSNGVVSTWTEPAESIESIQKRALRIIFGGNSFTISLYHLLCDSLAITALYTIEEINYKQISTKFFTHQAISITSSPLKDITAK